MYNKFAKVVSIAILLFTIPNNTLALNKDGLFTNLIRYSYPEVKVIEKDEQNTDKSDQSNKEDTTTNNNKATYKPLPAFSLSFSPPRSPLSRHHVKNPPINFLSCQHNLTRQILPGPLSFRKRRKN